MANALVSSLRPLAFLCVWAGFGPELVQAQVTETAPPPAVAHISIHPDRPAAHPISRRIFGSFLEPILSSTYGGLWAELLVNPSLEASLWSAREEQHLIDHNSALLDASDLGLPLPWEPLDPKQGARYEPHWGDAPNSWRSLEVMGVLGKAVGIKERIYLPVQRTLHYVGSLYARHLSGSAGLTISVRPRSSSQVLASAQILASATTWTKYSFSLDLPSGGLDRLAPADFVVQVEGDERVDLDELSFMPGDSLGGLDPDEVAMAKAMNTSVVRFGGNFTSGYHWRDGIGPEDKRISTVNVAWGIPEYNTFGTDEFLHFCELIGAQPQIALNLGSGSPQEAADWVSYVNAHFNQGRGGLLWELGNELWGSWNQGWPTLKELPGRTQAFSQAIRKVDPQAELIATGGDPKWNAMQLTCPAGTYNELSRHFVIDTWHVALHHPSPGFVAAADFALPTGLGQDFEKIQQQIDTFPAFAGITHSAFTEWLFEGKKVAPGFSNLGGALMAAATFNMLIRHSDSVPISDMTGIMEFGGIWKKREQVFATPAYYAFQLYSTAAASRAVAVETQAGSYNVRHGVEYMATVEHVPYLDVVATLNEAGDTLTLFCVNVHLSQDITSALDLGGFHPDGQATVSTLKSESILTGNDEVNPHRVVPTTRVLHDVSSPLTYTFPHESLTVLTFHQR